MKADFIPHTKKKKKEEQKKKKSIKNLHREGNYHLWQVIW